MKKAQGLSMETIIVIALALIVLVVIGVFFFSGMGKQSSLISQQVGSATGGETGMKKTECQSVCTAVSFTTISGSCTATNLANYPEVKEWHTKNCPCYSSCSVNLQGGGKCDLNTAWGCCTVSGVSTSTALDTTTNCGSCGKKCTGTGISCVGGLCCTTAGVCTAPT